MRKVVKNTLTALLVMGVAAGSLRVYADDRGTTQPITSVTKTQQEETEILNDPEFEDIVEVPEQKIDASKANIQDETQQNNDIVKPVSHQARVQVLADSQTLEVGKTASYRIVVGVDGANEIIPNLDLIIQLPNVVDGTAVQFNQNLETLALRDVIPSYDANTNQLYYHLTNLSGGFDTTLMLKLETENGSALNGQQLLVQAIISGDTIAEISSDASIELVANQNASISNKLRGIMVNDIPVDRSSIRYLDEAIFDVGFSINKFETGTVAPDTTDMIRFSYTLPEGVDYVRDSSGKTPTINGKTITWEFDATTNEDAEYYFNVNFNIITKVSGNLTLFSTVDTIAASDVKFIDGSSKNFQTKASVMISPNFEYVPDALFGGGPLTSVFSGPADSFGGVGWINNDDPSVTDGATLGWRLYLSSLDATSPIHGLNSYDAFFMPDQALNVTQIYTGKFYQRPSSAFPAGIPAEEDVFFSLSFRYAGETEWQRSIAELKQERYYYADEMGIDPNKKVSEIWFHFHDGENNIFADSVDFVQETMFKIPTGLTNMNLTVFTTIDEGYVGPVQSNAGIAYSGWYPQKEDLTNSYRTDQQSKYVPTDLKDKYYSDINSQYESRLAPKTAQVVTAPEGITRFIKSNITFNEKQSNLVNQGDNFIRLEINNDAASTQTMTGPFTTYALVDHGVEILDLDTIPNATVTVADTNYQNSNRTLLKIDLNVERLEINRRAIVRIPVRISENAPNTINVQMFGYLNETFSVSDVSNTDGSFTIRTTDSHDFDGDNDFDEYVYSTKNTFTYRNAYDFVATATAHDNLSVTMHPNTMQSFDLTVFNEKDTPFSSLELIGVLPRINDTFVTNDEHRNSVFDVYLTGPIRLPEGYESLFDVSYSTSQEPLIEGVLDINKDPELMPMTYPTEVDDQPWLSESEVNDFEAIKSFKISMKKDGGSIHEASLQFKMDAHINAPNLTGDEALADRIAFFSFGIAANQSNIFETQSVSVIYEKTPVYTIAGRDVEMYLSDVNQLIADQTFNDKLLESINPIVTKNDEIVVDPMVVATILDEPVNYAPGTYTVNLSYYDTLRSALAETTVVLTILDDPAEPIEPTEPTEPTDPVDKEETLPSTGVSENRIGYALAVAGLGMSIVAGLRRKRERNTSH